MAEAAVPVGWSDAGRGVLAAWRFVGPAWRRSWPTLGALCLALAAAIGAPGWARLPCVLIAVGLAIYGQAGLCEAAVEVTPSTGPRWRDARRLLAVWVLTALFVAIMSMLALVALLALAYGVASSGRGFVAASPATWARAVDQRGRWVVDLAAIIAALGVALAWARISLAPSITVAASRVIVLSSWAMTRGAGAPILLACLGVAAAPGALMWTIGGFFHPSMASRLAQGCVLGGLWFPQSVGLMAFFQSRLGLSPARVSPPQ